MCIDLFAYSLYFCFSIVFPRIVLVQSFFTYTRDGTTKLKKKNQPFLRLGIARYLWCMPLFANQFHPKPKCYERKQKPFPSKWCFRGFTRGTGQFIARHDKWVCIKHAALHVWWSQECKEFGLWIFIPGTHTIYLSGRQTTGWISTPLFYHLRCILSVGGLSLPSSCLQPMEVLLSDPDHRNEFFQRKSILETIPRPRNGNKPSAEASDKAGTISHCMCVNKHFWVCVFVCISVPLLRPTRVMKYHRCYQANSSVGAFD